jgi:mannose-6-phosphate isomerase-like protein (cupin superfamily)
MMNYMLSQLDEVPAQRCPCGFVRRAFTSAAENAAASLHIVDIQENSRTHYHKKMTEIYLVLAGEGQMELDGKLIPVRPMTAVYIKPGCRHRAIGNLKIINIPVPAFDEKDEWFD